MENTNNTGKLIGALLVGAAVGGALGILFAPDKGSKTRRKIAGKTNELTDALKEKLNDFMEEFEKDVEKVKHQAHEFMGDGVAEKVK